MVISKILTSALTALAVILPSVAAADSCWWHNGSLMRLAAAGEQRAFYYENPRAQLYGTGIGQGTLLFNGVNRNGYYSGTARVFSSSCPGQALEYYVEGPVGYNQTTVTMQGQRPVRNGCYGTGQYTVDVLTFTYSHQC